MIRYSVEGVAGDKKYNLYSFQENVKTFSRRTYFMIFILNFLYIYVEVCALCDVA